jgi:hypothetical protein
MGSCRHDLRRNFSFFSTDNLAKRGNVSLTQQIEPCVAPFRKMRRSHLFTIDAVVLLPIVSTRSRRCVFLRAFASDQIGLFAQLAGRRKHSDSHDVKGERVVWQRRCWDHTIPHE